MAKLEAAYTLAVGNVGLSSGSEALAGSLLR